MNGNRKDVANYRHINILDALTKILEHLVYQNIYFGILSRISISQHGF